MFGGNGQGYGDGDPAYVYVATKRGAGRVIWKTTVADARRICALDESHGKIHGSEWAYFWTTAANFEAQGGKLGEKKRSQKDDGRFDKLFAELGIEATAV
ncbi:MAG: hypothetical protein LBJ10_08130 [Clostridiales bacterium]|nr:hypothetical protein [Clostridiales bacterium]